MSRVHLAKENELTRKLAERHQTMWDAYVSVNEEEHSRHLAEEFRAVSPDGTIHVGKPSAAEIAAQPIEDYWLREFEAWPVGEEGAITTYTAEVEVRRGLSAERFRFAVGEVWMKYGEEWKCRYYHATMLK